MRSLGVIAVAVLLAFSTALATKAPPVVRAAGSCRVTFKGQPKVFDGCAKSSSKISVYWTLRTDDNEIDTLFQASTNGGFVSLGWGYSGMIGRNAVVAYQDSSGKAVIHDYALSSHSSSGVVPAESQSLTNTDVEVSNGVVTGIFTRKMKADGLPEILNGKTKAIWALGPVPSSATSLVEHTGTERGDYTLDLSTSSSSQTVADVLTDGSEGYGAVIKIHAVLMALTFIIVLPLSALIMRLLKNVTSIAFQLHRVLNIIAVIVSLVALAMGLSKGSRAEKLHLYLGCAVIGLVLVQTIGAAAPRSADKTIVTRRAWFVSHVLIAWLVLSGGATNVIIGLKIYGANRLWIIGCIAVIVAFFVLNVAIAAFMRFKASRDRKDGVYDNPGTTI